MAGTKDKKQVAATVDFSKVSRRWGKRWAQIDNDVQILVRIATSPEQEDLSDEEMLADGKARHEARIALNSLVDERHELMAQVLVDVPREYVVADAPAEIDWSDVESIWDYVREDASNMLHQDVHNGWLEKPKNLRPLISLNGDTQKPQ